MPGVYRPYTISDILGTLNQQNAELNGSQMVTGIGTFAEVDETLGAIDSMTATAQLNAVYDAGQWGSFIWG